jgi:hypothetical protein
MTAALTITCAVHFQRQSHGGRKHLRAGPEPPPAQGLGRVPRVARLMALALRFDDLVRKGQIASYAELARLGQVTTARISQIMNLLGLAPDLQEALLFLPRVTRGRDPLHLRQLQPIAATFDWRHQRRLWRALRRHGTG